MCQEEVCELLIVQIIRLKIRVKLILVLLLDISSRIVTVGLLQQLQGLPIVVLLIIVLITVRQEGILLPTSQLLQEPTIIAIQGVVLGVEAFFLLAVALQGAALAVELGHHHRALVEAYQEAVHLELADPGDNKGI